MQSGTFGKYTGLEQVSGACLLQCQATKRVKWEGVGFFWSGVRTADVTFTLLSKSKEIKNYLDVIEP